MNSTSEETNARPCSAVDLAIAAVALPLESNNAPKPAPKRRQGVIQKIESVLCAADGIETAISLIDDVKAYLLKVLVDDSRKKLLLDCLSFSVAMIRADIKSVRRSVDNLNEKKGSQQAHAILSKQQR